MGTNSEHCIKIHLTPVWDWPKVPAQGSGPQEVHRGESLWGPWIFPHLVMDIGETDENEKFVFLLWLLLKCSKQEIDKKRSWTTGELKQKWSGQIFFRWKNRLWVGKQLAQGHISGEWRSWDHCEIPQGLVLHSLYSVGDSGAATCSLAHPKPLHCFLILSESLKEEQTCLQVQVTWLECTLCRNNVIVLPLRRAGMSHLQ